MKLYHTRTTVSLTIDLAVDAENAIGAKVETGKALKQELHKVLKNMPLGKTSHVQGVFLTDYQIEDVNEA
jgi:hypothetical protein